MLTILLYGHLGLAFGRVHRYHVASAAEAVRALCATRPGFRKAIGQGAYRVLVGGKTALAADQLAHPVSARESLRIVPVLAGAGEGSINQMILGGAMIYFSGGLAGAFGATAATATSAATAGAFGITAGTFVGIGSALLLGGAAQLLFAPPAPAGSNEAPANMPSYAFNGAVNTMAQGHPVPLLYGELIVGSQVISAGLSVEQL